MKIKYPLDIKPIKILSSFSRCDGFRKLDENIKEGLQHHDNVEVKG